MDNLDKEDLSILILIPTLDKSDIDIIIMNGNTYYMDCKLKRTQVFAISKMNLKFQVTKKVKPKTDLKSIVPEEYHDLLDIFFQKTQIYLTFTKNTIIKPYKKRRKNIVIDFYMKCYLKNLM